MALQHGVFRLIGLDGAPHPVGQGASIFGDGATCLHHAESATRFAPAEVWENRNPWLVNRVELIQLY